MIARLFVVLGILGLAGNVALCADNKRAWDASWEFFDRHLKP
jgi:hypothetical protein